MKMRSSSHHPIGAYRDRILAASPANSSVKPRASQAFKPCSRRRSAKGSLITLWAK